MKFRQILGGILLLAACHLAEALTPLRTLAPTPSVELGGKADRLRLIAVGDTGGDARQVAQTIGRLHAHTPIDAIVLLGDNVYPCGVSSIGDPKWSAVRPILDLGIPILPVLGNHDYGNPHQRFGKVVVCGNPNPGAQVEASGRFPSWRFPSRTYEARSPVAQLVLVDTTPIAVGWAKSYFGSETASEIRDRLQAVLSSPTRAWRIVAAHHVIYASGIHGRSDDAQRRRMRELLPILEEHDVDLYLSGHDHHLELIGRSDSGTLFLISGAGSRLRTIGPRAAAEPPTIYPRVPSKTFLGFALLEMTTEELAIELYDAGGRVRSDRFVREKRSPQRGFASWPDIPMSDRDKVCRSLAQPAHPDIR